MLYLSCPTMDEAELVKKMLVILYSLSGRDISVNTSYRKFKFAVINGARIPSTSNRNVSVVLGKKFTGEENVMERFHPDNRPCKIHSFIQVPYVVNANILKHNFAIVSWYKEHPMRHSMGKPVQIWSKDLFECDDVHTYLSLSNSSIYRCIHTIIRLIFNNVTIIGSHTLMTKSLLLYHLFNNFIPCLLPFSLQ